MAANYSTLPSSRIKDLTGIEYGSWTVIRFDAKRCHHHYWICRCKCGSERSVEASHLRNGTSPQCKDCGYRRQTCDALGRSSYDWKPVIGYSGELSCYRNMLNRCFNPTATRYSTHGGRGITVCHRWRESFQAFLEDMGKRPSKRHSIERIDNDGNYDPGNCIWGTHREQSRNKRNSRYLTFNGQTKCLVDWADECGLKRTTLIQRLNAYGWSVERALTTPASIKPDLT